MTLTSQKRFPILTVWKEAIFIMQDLISVQSNIFYMYVCAHTHIYQSLFFSDMGMFF